MQTPGKHLSGKRLVQESDCPGIVRYPYGGWAVWNVFQEIKQSKGNTMANCSL